MPSSDYLRFDGKVAVVTGAGGGLGREYALLLASRGASVVVNDLGGSRSGSGKDSRAADLVVDEIRRAGGKAEANYDSVENGEAIIKTAIDKFGRIDILINNAGILRDRAFINISDDDWDLVHRVHLRGAYSVTKAAWPYLRKQNYGRVIFTSSNAGLFGNFGQTNYSSAKFGLIGLSKTLAIEGAKYQIQSNTIIPVAGSRLTEDVLPPNLFEQFKPKFVAPVVAWLCHESCPNTGEVFEAAGGWVGKYTWRRSVGKAFIPPETMSIEAVRDNWSKITNMDIATFPNSIQEQITQLVASVNDMEPPPLESSEQSHMNQDSGFFSYNTDNLILYALGVGVNLSDPSHLKYLNESHPDFAALPTFGVIPGLKAMFTSDMLAEAARKNGFSIDPTRVLHGEQYLEMLNPLPIDGSLKSSARIVDVLDKGSGALIIAEVDSQDTQGTPIYYNQFSIFLVGAGKFGGKRSSNNPQIKSIIAPPQRSPDAILTEQTSSNQAALYRLSGDKNPLHIDPNFAAVAGFNKPILHGLCSLGFVTRHVLKTFANDDPSLFKAVKARFSGIIYPGETIRTEMWQEGERVFMRSTVVETGKTIIEGAYVDLKSSPIKMSPYTSDSNSSANMSADPFKDDEVYLVSDPIFEEIGRRIEMAPDVASKVNAIYEFSIFKDGKNVRTWVLDLKTSQKGLFSGNHKSKEPNCIIKISDEDMAALAVGELDPVKGFMEGQIKIVGDPGITQKLNYIFKMDSSSAYYDSQPEAKPEPQILAGSGSSGSLPSSSSISMAPGGSDGSGGDGGDRCKIDAVFENWAAQRLSEMKSLIPTIKTIYQWNITKGGKVVSVWTCDFKNGDGAIHRGTPKTGKPDCSLTIDDEFVCRIFEGKEDAMRAFMSGKLKIGGNILAAQKLQQLWAEEAPNVAAQLAKQRQQQSSQQTETSSSKTSSDDKDPDVEAIPTTGYKCDLIFSVFRNRCHEEPDFMKRLRVVFQFNVLRDGKPACVWTADNKSQPGVEVYRDVPKGVKPDCQITMEDEELLKVMVGKVNPQRLFMQGKVRVKGNIMLLQKLNSLWQEYQKLGKNPELPIAMDILLDDPLKVGLKSESAVIDLVQRIVRLPELLREAKGLHNLNITKDGKVVSQWIINLTGDLGVIKRGSTPNPVSTLTVDDYDLARLTLMKLHLSDAISQGRVKIEGDKEKAMKFSKLFSTPTSLKPKL